MKTTYMLLLLLSSAAFAESTTLTSDDQKTNHIAYSVDLGNGMKKKLICSKLDLAMMDPTHKKQLLNSLGKQYGEAERFTTKTALYTPNKVFTSGRDRAVEKYGLRLRARKIDTPEKNNQYLAIINHNKIKETYSSSEEALLNTNKSISNTYLQQDRYLGPGEYTERVVRTPKSDVKLPSIGVNINLISPSESLARVINDDFKIYQGFEVDLTGRFDAHTYAYDIIDLFGSVNGATRDAYGYLSLGGRLKYKFELRGGTDWTVADSVYGLGIYAKAEVGYWSTFNNQYNSQQSNKNEDVNSFTCKPTIYAEVSGGAYIGKLEHVLDDDDTKMQTDIKGGVKLNVVVVGTFGCEFLYEIVDLDNAFDIHNNNMTKRFRSKLGSYNLKATARAELKFGSYTFQVGKQTWSRSGSLYTRQNSDSIYSTWHDSRL